MDRNRIYEKWLDLYGGINEGDSVQISQNLNKDTDICGCGFVTQMLHLRGKYGTVICKEHDCFEVEIGNMSYWYGFNWLIKHGR